jgi:hypothetical protein
VTKITALASKLDNVLFQLFNKISCLTVLGSNLFLDLVLLIEKVLSIAADVAGIAKYLPANKAKS